MFRSVIKMAAMGCFVTAISATAASSSRNLQQEEANRKLVLDFVNAANPKQVNEFIDKNVADNYRQHNPGVADGKEGMRAFFKDMMERFPNQKARVVHVAADGDLVWLHAHLTMNSKDPGMSLVDIFRIENGKFVEHWDIMQPVPEKSANNNSMF